MKNLFPLPSQLYYIDAGKNETLLFLKEFSVQIKEERSLCQYLCGSVFMCVASCIYEIMYVIIGNIILQ